jgi:tripartite-type tricarboxylate transporter receptor subunit TctC
VFGTTRSPSIRGETEEGADMTPRRRSILVVLVVFACWSSGAHAAGKPPTGEFPQRPIRLVVPFPPGGSNDVLGRYLAAKLGDQLREQVVIDNRGGANGIIGADLVAHASPDGYTLLMVSTSYVMNAAVRPLPYDVEKSFDPVSTIGSSPNSIVVHPGFVSSLRELVDRARAQPGSIFYAATGVGGFNHFGGELFNKVAGIKLTMVPYKGGGPAMVDVMSGQVPMMFSSVTQVLPHVRSGKLNVLAIGAAQRSPTLPDVPTVAEAGFPGYEVYVWWGIVAPAGVPRAVMDKLRREFSAVLADPETRRRLAADAAEPLALKPPEFRKMIHDDVNKWRAVAKQADIQLK